MTRIPTPFFVKAPPTASVPLPVIVPPEVPNAPEICRVGPPLNWMLAPEPSTSESAACAPVTETVLGEPIDALSPAVGIPPLHDTQVPGAFQLPSAAATHESAAA